MPPQPQVGGPQVAAWPSMPQQAVHAPSGAQAGSVPRSAPQAGGPQAVPPQQAGWTASGAPAGAYGGAQPGPAQYPGQGYGGQAYQGQAYQGQAYQGQAYPGQAGYPGQQGYPGQAYPGQQAHPQQVQAGWRPVEPSGNSALWTVLSIVPVLAVPIGVFVPENDSRVWDGLEAWSIFALLCAVVQLAPLMRSAFGWSPPAAWRIGAVGVGGLLLFWVLLVLPSIGRNTSFALTLGTLSACAALWLAPARQL